MMGRDRSGDTRVGDLVRSSVFEKEADERGLPNLVCKLGSTGGSWKSRRNKGSSMQRAQEINRRPPFQLQSI
jgi:hypothetical protein